MKPNEVNPSNEQRLRDTVYNYQRLIPTAGAQSTGTLTNESSRWKKVQRRSAKFKVGDYIRLSKYRTVFEKEYTPNWTSEIFKVRKVQYNTDPITYLLDEDQNGEIKGSVYAEELQLVENRDVYLVEKIIRRRNGNANVKWLGFGPEHYSWIPENDII